MPASAADTQAVRRLLTEVIDSFEKLEIVMHVHRASFQLAPVRDIAKAISLPVDEVDSCVHALKAEGVFDPAGPWRSSIDALVKMYDDDRIEVLNLMTSTSLERVRKQAARVFADAFVIRPTKKKGDPDA